MVKACACPLGLVQTGSEMDAFDNAMEMVKSLLDLYKTGTETLEKNIFILIH